jgi:dipeptidyl aminopeptidase/acylaminoacyl peptidase
VKLGCISFRIAGATLAALLLAPLVAQGQGSAPIPLRDFFRNPERAYFRISGDGKTLAFMQPWERRRNIYVQPIGSDAPPVRVTSEKDRDIPNYFWKGAERLVYLKDIGGDENDHVVVLTKDGKSLTDVTPFPGVKAIIISDFREDPNTLLVGLNKRNAESFDVYRLDLADGKLTMIAENPGNITAWFADHSGAIRAATTTDGVNQSYLYRDAATGAFNTVLTTSFREAFEPLVFSADNRKLYALSNLGSGRDKKVLVRVDPATAKEEAVLYERPDVDLDGVTYSYTRKRLATVEYNTAKPQRDYLDDDAAKLYKALGSKLPGYTITLQSLTDDEDRMIVAATSDRTAGTRYLYTRSTDTLAKLGEVAPWLPESKMAPVQPIEYAARDGLTIHGYLTLPLNKPAKNLPVVVNPHGGPWARDGWGFNPEVQFLASRGYAVLQMNFRGSTGYGRKFWEASFKQWGLAMQDDVTDGVKWLIDKGVADPKRVCIYGGSYGGYATLSGLAKTPDLYACGVDYVGVANMFTFMKTIPPYWRQQLVMFQAMVGDPVADREQLERTSPALNAEKIRSPLLIAQGARDPRVNKDESDQMVMALRARGIDVPYIVKDNEGHGFRNEENQFEFYEAMERFLAKHLLERAN